MTGQSILLEVIINLKLIYSLCNCMYSNCVFKKVEFSKLPAFSISIFSELYLLHSNEEKGLCNPISNHLGELRRSGNRSDLTLFARVIPI